MTERLMIDINFMDGKYFCQLSSNQDGEGGAAFDFAQASVAGVDIQTTGKTIFDELCKSREIKKAIERALSGTQPIYFNPRIVPAQGIRWEAVWAGPPAGFVSLDRRWPIARIAGTDTDRDPVRFAPPLRILAVISAAGFPGDDEWNALFDAARDAVTAGLPVEIRVVTGQAALYQSLNPSPSAWVTVAPVPPTADELSIQIGTFKPHILHFFCHGQTDAGNAHLVIEGNAGELQLSIRDLTQISGLEDVWLVVLNSCLGGASQQGYLSMAQRIVSEGNVPFAIGATETVDVRDANTFSRAFYKRLLFTFGDNIKKTAVNGILTLSWGEALYAARDAINKTNGNKPEAQHQWILPILYEHRTRLQLIKQEATAAGAAPPPAPDPSVALRAKMASELLAALPPGTSDATKKSLVAAILNQPNG